MPAWIHNRADHIRQKNPSMAKSEAFAIATQQAYATDKAPSKYGTTEGRRKAKSKYDGKKSEYENAANPSHKVKTSANLTLWKGFSEELQKISALKGPMLITKTTPAYSKATGAKLPTESKSDPMNVSKTLPPPPVTAG